MGVQRGRPRVWGAAAREVERESSGCPKASKIKSCLLGGSDQQKSTLSPFQRQEAQNEGASRAVLPNDLILT